MQVTTVKKLYSVPEIMAQDRVNVRWMEEWNFSTLGARFLEIENYIFEFS